MPSADALIWIDLEMTGLLPESDTIIEIATLVTTAQLELIAEGPVLAIHQDEATLARMGYTHPILVADHAFADAFHGAGWSHVTPVTYVLDGQGRISASLRGHQELEALLAALPADAVQPGSGDER